MKISDIAAKLSLVDDSGQLSWANVALIVVLAKLCIAANGSMVDLGALLGVLLNIGHERHVTATAVTADDNSDALTALQKDVSTLKTAITLKGTR